jgi:hypothetical protein
MTLHCWETKQGKKFSFNSSECSALHTNNTALPPVPLRPA